MASLATSWDRSADQNPVIQFVDTVLRGAGQVMFQNNPLTGLLFIVGIFWGSIVAGMPQVGIGAVVGLLTATITAILLDVDKTSLRTGLYGFNGILVGCAVPTFLDVTPLLWLYIIVGAATSTVVMLAIANVFKTWGVPALTFPFVLTSWFLMLAAYSFANIPIASLGPAALPQPTTATTATITADPLFWVNTLLVNVSQVFLINNPITGIIFLIAIAVSSRWSAAFAVLGALVAVIASVVLGANSGNIGAGLYGFSAVLTAIALGSVFYTPSRKVFFYALLGTIFTVIVQGAMDTLLAPVGIPTFTAPFVFANWLFLLPKENFAPVPHEPVKGGAVSKKQP